MAKCRFFTGEHSYSASECDPDFCWQVLDHGKPRKREVPLELEPDPDNCRHEWEIIYGRLYIPGSRRIMGGKYLVPAGEEAKVVMSERRFDVCIHCGAVSHYHDQLGTVMCHPVKYGG
jgi:hypothetical protein